MAIEAERRVCLSLSWCWWRVMIGVETRRLSQMASVRATFGSGRFSWWPLGLLLCSDFLAGE